MLVLGTNFKNLFVLLFHGLQALAKRGKTPLFYRLLDFSTLRYSIDLPILTQTTICVRLAKSNLCYHAYFESTGILTSFPFPNVRITKSVRIDLPLTDLHCQGTLALSVTANLTLLCSYSYQDLHCKQIHVSSRTRFYSINTPAYRTHF